MRTPSQVISELKSGDSLSEEEFPYLVLAEQALGEGETEVLNLLKGELTESQLCVLEITACRISGQDPGELIEKALEITSSRENRDLHLEGRVRMERGLQRFVNGDVEGADEDLTWAETRLKSVAKASRDHDLSLLNKASFHLSTNAPLMALQVYGEISKSAGHAAETLTLSRLGAARILASIGQLFPAIRNAWNASIHARNTGYLELQWQANTLFLGLAADNLSDTAAPMSEQVVEPGTRSYAEDGELPAILPADLEMVFDETVSLESEFDGVERPDLRGLLLSAVALDRIDEIPWLDSGVQEIEDPVLVSAMISVLDDERVIIWQNRMNELMQSLE